MTREEAWAAYQQAEAQQEAARRAWQVATDQAQAAYDRWKAADRAALDGQEALLNPGDEAAIQGADS